MASGRINDNMSLDEILKIRDPFNNQFRQNGDFNNWNSLNDPKWR